MAFGYVLERRGSYVEHVFIVSGILVSTGNSGTSQDSFMAVIHHSPQLLQAEFLELNALNLSQPC